MKVGYARVIEKRIKLFKVMAGIQLFVMVLMFVVGFLIAGVFISCSLLMGSLCSVIPSIYFSYRAILYKFKIEGNPKKFLANILFAEVVKFLLVGCFLAAGYLIAKETTMLSIEWLTIGFVITYLSVLGAPLVSGFLENR